MYYKIFNKWGLLIVLFTNYMYAVTFEQDGVKEGNIRLSMGLFSEQDNSDKPNNISLYANIGYFINDDFELSFGVNTVSQYEDTSFTLSPGLIYYFYKTPILTPYIGAKYYYENSTNAYVLSREGATGFIGTHLFLNENVALTPEFGANYIDKKKQNTYFNTSLSYFF